MGLIRLVYASQAIFREHSQEHGIDPRIERILTESRNNNSALGLVGSLCYGNGYFFQCIEGESDNVHRLFNRIRDDDRHSHVTLLYEEVIDTPDFEPWSMKYVRAEGALIEFLQQKGFSSFDPFSFDADTIRSMVNMLGKDREHAPGVGRNCYSVRVRGTDYTPVLLATLLVAAAFTVAWFII